jgi:hypothetical protein
MYAALMVRRLRLNRYGVFLLLAGCGAPVSPELDAGVRDAVVIDAPADDAPRDDAAADLPVRSTDFAEATGEVRNPDRGFYFWDDHDEAALVLVKVQLGEWCDTATLPSSVLDDLTARLDAHRTAGRRAIVRFLYADDSVLNACGLADAASIEIVEGHIAQLAPVLRANEDVIAFVEAGFLGMWGEWNQESAPAGTSLSAIEEDRDRVLTALLAAVPPSRSIGVRRPRFRDEYAAPMEDLARIGFHDDCFLASDDDWGTYDGARTIDQWKTYIVAATETVPIGGETCNDDATFTACDEAIGEMQLLRFSYLHEGYLGAVIDRWRTEGCLEEIRQRLGYRVVVRAVTAPSRAARGERVQVRIEMENVGFAPPYDSRRLQIVLRNADGDAVVLGTPATIHAEAWAPGAPFGFLASATIPGDLATGVWEVRFAMLEDASDAPAYAMLFANDERVRDDARRENIVATITVE